MATDYDAPRKNEDEQSEESIEELKARRHDKNSGKVDEDEAEAAESFELPGADLSHEELAVEVKPKQDDEFTVHELLPRAPPVAAGRREEDDLQGLRLTHDDERGPATDEVAGPFVTGLLAVALQVGGQVAGGPGVVRRRRCASIRASATKAPVIAAQTAASQISTSGSAGFSGASCRSRPSDLSRVLRATAAAPAR